MPDIELTKIKPNRLNPRTEFSKLGLDELSDSMKMVGVLEPVIVREVGDDSYEIVVGERRYRAAQQAGLEVLPVVVKDYNDEEVLEILTELRKTWLAVMKENPTPKKRSKAQVV